jgi:methylmalonyl-CoA mutase
MKKPLTKKSNIGPAVTKLCLWNPVWFFAYLYATPTSAMEHEALFDHFPPAGAAAWKKQILKEIKAATDAEKEALFDRKLRWRTPEGIVVEPFYTPESLASIPAVPLREKAGWRGREEINAEAEAVANRWAHEALAGGIDDVGFDLRCKNDAHADALLAGLSAKGPIRLLVDGISLNMVRQPASRGAVSVIAVDWLSRPAAPETAHYDQLATLVRGSGALPGKRPLVIGGGSVHDAGAAATQELAFTLAAFVDCVDQLTDRGLDAKTIFANTELSLAADTNFFFQVAKFRALRLLAGQVGAAYSVRGAAVEVHGRTARWNKFRQDAYNNMLRATLEAMAAVLGGCDTLTVEPYNVRFAEPDALSRRVARNVHAILREESYLAKVADPAAGAYYIENTTYALAGRAWELFQAVEGQGGYWAARQNGFLRREIETVRAQKEAAIRSDEQVLVGINKYLPQGGSHLPEALFEPLPEGY